MKLSTEPYKGTKDWLPKDFRVQKYIFDTWRSVCEKFGYKEYLTPLLEKTELYKAKSGEVKEELFTLKDRADRDLSLRPEMTPSVTRMVSNIYNSSPKPIRLFSIAPFYRNEAPQKGRTREFWQLNADIFGSDSINADIEILSLAIEIMLAFNAPKSSFKLYFNSRKILEEFFTNLQLNNKTQELARYMDKYEKIGKDKFIKLVTNLGLNNDQIDTVIAFLQGNYNKVDLSEINSIQNSLIELGYQDYVEFKPSVVRGFEYYDGLIFEVFDLNPTNSRSLFGGGRYNGLAEIFGKDSFPATGFAPGNITTELFLKNWDLIPDLSKKNTYYVPLLDSNYLTKVINISNKLRNKGLIVINGIDVENIPDALRTANKNDSDYVVLLGSEEIENSTVTIKNMISGTQETKPLETFISDIS